MLIARAPVRISFVGGGTDLPDYYKPFGGIVVSTTINKYFYVFASLSDGKSIQITSSDYPGFFHQDGDQTLWDDDMSLPRALLREFGVDTGLSLFLASEIPPGTGLGSSSAVAVALCKALSTLAGRRLEASELAECASEIEIDRLARPIGRQDQYASAFGGLNVIRFDAHGVSVQPLELDPEVERELERRTILFFTGSSRSAADILRDQSASVRQGEPEVLDSLHRLKEIAEQAVELLRAGELDAFAALLDEAWQAKKTVASGVSTERIDRWYEVAREAGAAGGKILGAGGGGFLMLSCRPEAQARVTETLERDGLIPVEFRFEAGGATILMNSLGLPRNGSNSFSRTTRVAL
jgi:D-glycero-alpha-D-manno-heptose-7-phosphate kinase